MINLLHSFFLNELHLYAVTEMYLIAAVCVLVSYDHTVGSDTFWHLTIKQSWAVSMSHTKIIRGGHVTLPESQDPYYLCSGSIFKVIHL